MNIGERIKQRRKQLKISADQVAEKIGVSRSSVFRYEKGEIEKLPIEILVPLSEILQTTPGKLMGWDQESDISTIYNQLEPTRQEYVYGVAEDQLDEQLKEAFVPYQGGAAANPTELGYGDPVYDTFITQDVPDSADGALTIHGDSMEPEYKDGDIVFYRYQPDVENGQIAIVEIDGNGVTCKKVIKNDDQILLRSLNDKYEDRKVDPDRIRILGKVVK